MFYLLSLLYKRLNNYFRLKQSRSNLVKMEDHVQSVDDALIGGLSHKLKPGASYVTNRRSVSYCASGGNTYSPNGVKVMKSNLAGDQWLDPSTFRVANLIITMELMVRVFRFMFSLLVGIRLSFFFRRARLICGGQVVEDIDDFNRLSLTLTDLWPEDDQSDIACEGFGDFDFVKGKAAQAADQRKSYRQTGYDLSGNVTLARRVMFEPMLGLFNQDKLLPLRYCPIRIELEFVTSQADAVFLEVAEGFCNGLIGILVIFSVNATF